VFFRSSVPLFFPLFSAPSLSHHLHLSMLPSFNPIFSLAVASCVFPERDRNWIALIRRHFSCLLILKTNTFLKEVFFFTLVSSFWR
jgi:hypothetical protein